MHAAIELMVFWLLAFVSLCLSVLLLAIFSGLVEGDLELRSLGKEAAIAAVASLIEAASLWLVAFCFHGIALAWAMRGMIIPLLVVALIYKATHLEDWSRYEALLLLMFQIAMGCFVAALVTAHFGSALVVLTFFTILLVGIVFFYRSM